jgi:hypothetical protein
MVIADKAVFTSASVGSAVSNPGNFPIETI